LQSQEETAVAALCAEQVSFSKKYKSVISVKLINSYTLKNSRASRINC